MTKSEYLFEKILKIIYNLISSFIFKLAIIIIPDNTRLHLFKLKFQMAIFVGEIKIDQ